MYIQIINLNYIMRRLLLSAANLVQIIPRMDRIRMTGSQHDFSLQQTIQIHRFCFRNMALSKLKNGQQVIYQAGWVSPNAMQSCSRQAAYKGQQAKAEPLYVACLEQRRIALGETHPDTLSSMNNLANLYDSQGQYAKAEPLLWVACPEERRLALGETNSFGYSHLDE